MHPAEMLKALVAYESVVGRPNGALVDFIQDRLSALRLPSWIISGPEGDRFNIFATIGPEDVSGYVLSGHLDVVPAGDAGWMGDPFTLRAEGERLIGRGATDMKGFVAAILSVAADLARMPLRRPVHIALSYDEEAGCRGVRHLLGRLPSLCAPPLGCIVGEPSGLRPVLAHKGKAAVRIEARGISGHSSRPDQGQNAIHALLPALSAVVRAAGTGERQHDPVFEPPHSTIQIGRIGGGEAINVIPDSAWAEVEARAIPSERPMDLLRPLIAAAEADEALRVETMSAYPGLSLEPDHPLARLVERLTGAKAVPAVSYGTEAGLFQESGIPAVVCGPGDIARAHRPEEYITRAEIAAAADMVRALGRALCTETA